MRVSDERGNQTVSRVLRLAGFVLIAAVSVLPLSAQVATAELSGTVTDPTGAAVPNATVTAINAATGGLAPRFFPTATARARTTSSMTAWTTTSG